MIGFTGCLSVLNVVVRYETNRLTSIKINAGKQWKNIRNRFLVCSEMLKRSQGYCLLRVRRFWRECSKKDKKDCWLLQRKKSPLPKTPNQKQNSNLKWPPAHCAWNRLKANKNSLFKASVWMATFSIIIASFSQLNLKWRLARFVDKTLRTDCRII